MDFSEVISRRFSVRAYKNIPIEDSKLEKVLNAGRIAPSAVNYQPWVFIVAKGGSQRDALNSVYHREWFKSAPVVIVVCADHSCSWKRGSDGKDFADVDAAIAIDHMTLEAVNQGLGTCWICNFDAPKCKELFGIPHHVEPIALLPIGYPDSEPPVKNRKGFDEVVFWGQFGGSRH